MIGKNGVSLLIGHNGVQDKTTLNPANETVARGIYDATTLSAVDSDLATANIKNGITLFGFAGSADVQDISDATAIAAEVITGETFYAVSGGIRTGTMPIVALAPGSSAYPAGYHVGDGGGLPAIDADLATGNIKSGITIFGVAGHADVRDVSDANALVGEVKTGSTFYAVGGAKKTGSGTKTLNPANETVAAGYYAATTLSAVDGDLSAGNIKSGVTIFGFTGPATVQDISGADAVLADVRNGKTFFSVTGGIKTGNLATVALAAGSNAYPAGYHVGAANLTAVDGDLVAGNIADGITIFGVLGTFSPAISVTVYTHVDSAVSTTSCTTQDQKTETVGATVDEIYAWYMLSRVSGTWTFRIKYKGVTKAEVTGKSSANSETIDWTGAGDGGGILLWQTHCESDGMAWVSMNGCEIEA